MINISKRLKDIISHLDFSENILDIGCDHGQLVIFLIQNNLCNHLYASDNKISALNNAKKNVLDNNLENNISLLLGDGLNIIKDEKINTLILSGMGTKNILKILNHSKLKQISKLIIQSNNHHYLLRKEIENLGFQIEKETVVKDHNKYYLTISFLRGKNKLSMSQLKYGIHNDINYLNFQLKQILLITKTINKDDLKYKSYKEEASILKGLIDDLTL